MHFGIVVGPWFVCGVDNCCPNFARWTEQDGLSMELYFSYGHGLSMVVSLGWLKS